jgi:hypothetical protein
VSPRSHCFPTRTDQTLKRHDFNENLGKVKVKSFKEKFPQAVENFKFSWVEYMKYCYRMESAEEVESATESQSTLLIELDRDEKGFPLLPPAQEGDDLNHMKRLIRSFLAAHYRKSANLILVLL